MCANCGCSDGSEPTAGHEHGHEHVHEHVDALGHVTRHAHAHPNDHDHGQLPRDARGTITLDVEARLLAKNDLGAERNRRWFATRGILALNLVSSPGAGKTSLLVRTIREFAGAPISVIEGDQATTRDADRIRATGAPAVQVNTGTGCHLDADMVRRGLDSLAPIDRSILMIENVGNLVCPAMFDLGEHAKVAILSVTEGDDKPLKYPHMFRAASLMIVNKVDLAPYVEFDIEAAIGNARLVNPGIESLVVSAATGAGIERWYEWLRRRRELAA